MNRADVLRKLRAALEPQRDLPFRLAYSRDEVLEALAHAAQVEERLEAGAAPGQRESPMNLVGETRCSRCGRERADTQLTPDKKLEEPGNAGGPRTYRPEKWSWDGKSWMCIDRASCEEFRRRSAP